MRDMAQCARLRTFRKGALIFGEGDPGDAFSVLVEGNVKVFVTSDRGYEMVLATLGPPDTLGEIALFDGGERSASVEALDPVTALVLARPNVHALLREDHRA